VSDSASLNAHFGAAIDRLINRAASNSDNTPEPHLLIALSGGVDSVVLASRRVQSGRSFVIAFASSLVLIFKRSL